MSKANFRLPFLFSNFENHFCIYPLAFVLCETEIVVHNEPNHPLCRDQLNDLHFAAVNIFMVIGEFAVEPVGASFDIFGPPSTDIVDSIKSLLWRLIYQYGSREILIFHVCFFIDISRSWSIDSRTSKPLLAAG